MAALISKIGNTPQCRVYRALRVSKLSVNASAADTLANNVANAVWANVAATLLAKQADLLQRPVNPLLANDARLNNLDAAISTRLAASNYTAPANTGILNALAAIPINPLLAADYVAPDNVKINQIDLALKKATNLIVAGL
jgi:hypothetical protein